MKLTDIQRYIPPLQKVTAITKIDKGFSFDGKYFLSHEIGRTEYVLRTAALKHSEQKRQEYEMIRRSYELGVRTSRPIEFGITESMNLCWMVLAYVEGEDASEVLQALSPDEQYQIGMEAGRDLRLLHTMESTAALKPWHLRRTAKYKRHFAGYLKCGVKLPQEGDVASFIEENLKYMKGRSHNQFQHDDFHPSNLLVHDRRYAAVIDFNRFDWGDPFHDFMKVAYFSREVSIPFSIGQIEGYFNGQVPEGFWHLYALYTAMTIFPSITWTLEVVPQQLDSMMQRIQVVLEDHKNFENRVPAWYKPWV